MIERYSVSELTELMDQFPAVGIIGPRQVGKTTLAKQVAKEGAIYVDLESDIGLSQLSDPGVFLRANHDRTVIIDEVQLMPQLFPLLRSIIDEDRRSGRFILLGSAAPSLIRKTAESLAGRIAYIELTSFLTSEVPNMSELWLKGGFPLSYLAKSNKQSNTWRNQLLGSYIQRDLPQLGLNANPRLLSNLLRMLAHNTSSLWNASNFAKSLGLTAPTLKRYLEYLEGAFIIDVLEPYHTNVKKRITKTPKTFYKDTGLLHTLLKIPTMDELQGHPVLGSSWENFVIQQVKGQLGGKYEYHFYRTHDGSEVDLVLLDGSRPIASIEIKYTLAPKLSKGNRFAIADVNAERNFICTFGTERYMMEENIEVIGLNEMIAELR
ncbi:MAG: ATP-binding protein [Cyclobacteriaceae bacterium]